MARKRTPDAQQLQLHLRALWLAVMLMLLAGALYPLAARSAESGSRYGCGPVLLHSLHEARRQLDSLRPDKSGQTRVFAPDGSNFTTGQAKWMQAELRSVEQSCALGDATGAAEHLSNVQNLLQSHVLK
jgi:hypothetical protein